MYWKCQATATANQLSVSLAIILSTSEQWWEIWQKSADDDSNSIVADPNWSVLGRLHVKFDIWWGRPISLVLSGNGAEGDQL